MYWKQLKDNLIGVFEILITKKVVSSEIKNFILFMPLKMSWIFGKL